MTIRISADVQAVANRFAAAPGVITAIQQASAQTGTQFETLLASAALESGLRPTAQAATSSASGLFQFTAQTWLSAMRQHGAAHGLGAEAASIVQRNGQLTVDDPAARQRILNMRQDPVIASQLAGDHLRDLSAQIAASTGQMPDAGSLYLGHFLGGAGASQMLQALQATPDRPAAAILPSAAQANQSLFYAKDGTPYSVAQFVQNVRGRVANAFSEIGATMPQGPVTLTGSPTPGQSADAPDSGASGWGVSTPRQVASIAQRSMDSLLAEVFLRLDHAISQSQNNRQQQQNALPQAVLFALPSQ